MKIFLKVVGSLCAALMVVAAMAGPALAQGSDDVASPTTSTSVSGLTGTEILAEINARAAAADAAAAAAATAAAQAAAAAGDEVLGVSVTSSDQLAFTGGSVNLPIAIGSTLIGLGGLLLLAERKRQH